MYLSQQREIFDRWKLPGTAFLWLMDAAAGGRRNDSAGGCSDQEPSPHALLHFVLGTAMVCHTRDLSDGAKEVCWDVLTDI